VVRHHFHDEKEAEREVFRHPRRLQTHEMQRLRDSLPKSLQHATSRVKEDGKEAIDFLGMGLMHSHSSSEGSRSSPPAIDSPSTIDGQEAEPDMPPIIRVDSGKKGLRQRLFGGGDRSVANDVEQGRANPDLLSAQPTSQRASVPAAASNDDSLSRSISNRNPAIRFAPDIAPSSDTAPGINNYGSSAPGFKRNPNLSMSRSSSIQSADDNREEPDRPR
jgi:hypothetical protein